MSGPSTIPPNDGGDGESLRAELSDARRQLDTEKEKNAVLAAELASSSERLALREQELDVAHRRLKELAATDQARSETEQELIVNRLQKHIDTLRKHRHHLQRERGELEAQVARLSREKVELELAMEAEEEGIVNRLTRQIEFLVQHSRRLEHRLEALGRRDPSDSDAPSVSSLASSLAGSMTLTGFNGLGSLHAAWSGGSPPARALLQYPGDARGTAARRGDRVSDACGGPGAPATAPLMSEPSSPYNQRRRSGPPSRADSGSAIRPGQLPTSSQPATPAHPGPALRAAAAQAPSPSRASASGSSTRDSSAHRPGRGGAAAAVSLSGSLEGGLSGLGGAGPRGGSCTGYAAGSEAEGDAGAGPSTVASSPTAGPGTRVGGARGGKGASRPGSGSTVQSMGTSAYGEGAGATLPRS